MDDNLQKSSQQLEKELETNIKTGLNSEQVLENQKKYGKNQLPQGKVTPWYLIFLKTLTEPILVILMIAAIISIIAPMISNGWHVRFEEFIDAIVIFSIVLIDAVLETIQTLKARKSMDALKSLSKPKAIVIRNGEQIEIDASELTIGDIVVLEAGKYVPAELRLVEVNELTIDESILTGESIPVIKTDKSLEKSTSILAEQINIAFMSTFTTNGRAIGIVIKIGKDTEIGKIAQTINENDEQDTPLEIKLHKFTYWISGLSFIFGVIIFLTLFLTGQQSAWANYLMVSITLAIGVIPECLAAVVSITLSISTKKMAKQNVIVKKLQAVETLGSVNFICTDKTGTLTQNKMTVKQIIFNNIIVKSEEYISLNSNIQKDLLLKALVLCNDSITENDQRLGDPTELALVDFAELCKYDEIESRNKWPRIFEIPFDSERKMMTTVNTVEKENLTFTKGAIDQLLENCSKILIDNVERKITKEDKEQILQSTSKLSDNALRVLGFAYKKTNSKEQDRNTLESDLIFIGAVGMIDPVRESAVSAVAAAREAGIQVVMITGDHASTALAIAKDLDLAHSEYEVMSSEMLNTMTDVQLLRIIEQIKVFARVNPEHKVKIVELLQQKQNLVSMTGDGVNDAPSLAKAEIGVAMGITGTDVAKQAADVILTDDNFETIIKGVNEGRNVYQKIKRAIAFIIGANLANVFAIFILSAINTISPLEATDILWMNLIVESILALSIGLGDNDPTVMKVAPIKGKNSLFKGLGPVLTKIIIFNTIASIGAFYFGMSFAQDNWIELLKQTDDIEEKIKMIAPGRTAMFIVITISPCVYVNFIKLSNWKVSKKITIVKNNALIYASLGAIGLNLIALFIPGLNNKVLSLVSINQYNEMGWLLLFGSIGIAMIPTMCILLTDLIIFLSYHYLPDPWTRNQILVNEMVEKDYETKKQLRASKKRKKDL